MDVGGADHDASAALLSSGRTIGLRASNSFARSIGPFTIKVVGDPVMIGVEKFDTSTTVSWRTAADQYSDSITPPSWANLVTVLTATGFTSSRTDTTIGTNSQRYHRVQFLEPREEIAVLTGLDGTSRRANQARVPRRWQPAYQSPRPSPG